MNKKLNVLAALVGLTGLAGIASAQSTVTLYGRVDIGVSYANNGTSVNPGASSSKGQWSMQQGTASRFGLKGEEDLGGGMYARFNIENRFFADTGAQDSAAFFKGLSIVAVGSKTAGELYLGRDVVPAYYITCTADPTCWSYTSQPGQPYAYANYSGSAPSDNSGIRRNNSIGYRSPNMGGVTTELAYAFGEGMRRPVRGFNVQYNQGPVYAGVGLDDGGKDDNGNKNRLWIVGGGYDFGMVRPLFTYSDAKGGIGSPVGYAAKSASLVLVMPTPVGRVFFGGGHLKANSGFGTSDVKSTKILAGADYNLSKRTALYANVGSAKTDDKTRSNAFDIGITHKF